MGVFDRAVATRSQNVTRLVLGAFMVLAGLAHLTVGRQDFHAQVPEWLPVNEDFVVLASGVLEIGLGIALLALPRYRRITGLVLAVFFVLVFPGNVAQYVEGITAFGLDTDAKRLARLFGQPLLISGALWSAAIPERAVPTDCQSQRAE
ncbi:DoxX family protein [Demetria terragena]|uniref:DoxX family protein n=1 Tax=Demetria terragena TaxID=63959 RepID=UPI00035D9E00|nr:DoxX family membrane protein [Demetria terragena]